MRPRRYGPWFRVNAYFFRWRIAGIWEHVQVLLRERVRRQAVRAPTPSAAVLDGQSVETSERGDPHGYDGAQELPGRKRHALVDTLGLALGVVAHPIDLQ